VDILLNPERVAPVGRNRVAVEISYSIHYPGLPQRQPWALRHNRFAVKQFESQGCEIFPNLRLHFKLESTIGHFGWRTLSLNDK
jgi:hypothetical protein